VRVTVALNDIIPPSTKTAPFTIGYLKQFLRQFRRGACT
jgi:hypothetical protein